MGHRRRPNARAVGAAVAVALLAAGAARSAPATDLAAVQARAQELGHDVTALEQRLEGLNVRRAKLEADIGDVSREMAELDLKRRDAQSAYDAALGDYVSAAVELYKSGGAPDLELLLSSQTIGDAFTVAEAAESYDEAASQTLDELLGMIASLEAAQREVEARKQTLIASQAQLDDVSSQIAAALADRQAVLDRLTAELDELERQARLAAAQTSAPAQSLLDLLGPAGPSQGIPDGFVPTGVSFEGIASWYGPGFEGNPTANGDIFDPDLYTAASKELPFGTWLYVEYGGRGVVVLINDRGPYIEGRILDLSQAAAEAIGLTGIGWVRAQILIKTTG